MPFERRRAPPTIREPDSRNVIAPSSVSLWILITLVFATRASLAYGQTPERRPQAVPPAVEEAIELRIIGRPGTTMIGMSGFVDRAFSTEALMPLNYTVEASGLRFITRHIAVDGAVAGSGSFGGDDSASVPTGIGVASLRLMAGGLYFLTPQSMISLYGGGDYATQLTRRSGSERGAVVGKLGIQAAMSARVALFVGRVRIRGHDGIGRRAGHQNSGTHRSSHPRTMILLEVARAGVGDASWDNPEALGIRVRHFE